MSDASNPSGGASLSADQVAAMNELTTRMATMGNDQHDARLRLGDAVHDEIGRGGTGWNALNANPSLLSAQVEVRQAAEAAGDGIAPAGQTPASEYTNLYGHVFAGDEGEAFGSVMSAAGLDVGIVHGLLEDVAHNPQISRAMAGGEAAIDARLHEVRQFFERQPGGMDDLRLAVAFGEHIVAKDGRLADVWNAGMLSENVLFSLASEARRLGFTPPAKR